MTLAHSGRSTLLPSVWWVAPVAGGGGQHVIMLMVFALFVAVLTSGCPYISFSERGVREEDRVDWTRLGGEVMRIAGERATDRARRDEVRRPDHPVTIRTQEALDTVLTTLPATASVGGGFFEKREPFEYFHRDRVRLVVVVADQPTAEVYPDGLIYISTGFVDPDLPSAAKSWAALVGILVHEVTHLHRGHVLRQWITIEARKREVFKQALAGLTALLSIVSYQYEPGASYQHAAVFNRLVEYEADVGALQTLQRLELPPEEYAGLLDRLAKHPRGREASHGALGWIAERARCFQEWFASEDATTTVIRTIGDRHDETTVILSPEQRYALCGTAHVYLTTDEASKVAAWLAKPVGTLNDVLATMPADERAKLAGWGQSVLWGALWGK
jgi:hypothetical protein